MGRFNWDQDMLDLKGYETSLLEGAWMTLEVALLSLLLAMVLVCWGPWPSCRPVGWARQLATLYTTLVRGVPDLVLMMLLFFGGQVLVNNLCTWGNEWLNGWLGGGDPQHEWVAYLPEYVDVSPFLAGVLTIGFIFGAYMAETFRGAILAVDKGQLRLPMPTACARRRCFAGCCFPRWCAMPRRVLATTGWCCSRPRRWSPS